MIQVNPVCEKVEEKVEEENTLANGKLTFMVGSIFFFRVKIKYSTR
jgi:hypothetical protein